MPQKELVKREGMERVSVKGVVPVLLTGADYRDGVSGIDPSTEAVETIDYEHHEIHEGDHYFIQDVEDIAINNVFDIQWTTPDTTKWAHFTFFLSAESETEWYIYEGATINVAGTAITPVNNNRNSANTSGMTVAGISNTSVANANADTDVSGATVIAHGIVGAGRDSGIMGRSNEIIFKQDTVYCLRAIATAAGFISFNVEWYEHTAKN